ncbi:MAG TPA: hypothetical protein VGP82_00760 [Ktedonobacterales bacterium]|nr:hypothetical protein [Ktedonobacterales bacterium]
MLTADFEVLARDVPRGLTATMTALWTTAQRALGMRQAFLPTPIMARVLHHATLGIGQKHLQTHIQANHRMVARYPLRMYDALLILGARFRR